MVKITGNIEGGVREVAGQQIGHVGVENERDVSVVGRSLKVGSDPKLGDPRRRANRRRDRCV